MKLAVLFSGGKDSTYALYKAMQHEIKCLITIKSKNKESYMFHTPNIDITRLQAEAIGIPLLKKETPGDKEEELSDLKKVIIEAKEKYHVAGVVTGAIESVYQASRVQKICDELNLWCFNPLWKKDQIELLEELIDNNFEVIITAVAAYPLDKKWLGKRIDKKCVEELKILQKRYKINPAGEGGEFETLVLDAPIFSKRIKIIEQDKVFEKNSGVLIIKAAI